MNNHIQQQTNKVYSQSSYKYSVRSFLLANSNLYYENNIPDRNFLYLFKIGFPDFIIRVDDPIKKQNSWQMQSVQLIVYKSSYGYSVHEIQFKGDLLWWMLDHFNTYLGRQITLQLGQQQQWQKWIQVPIHEVYWVRQRTSYTMGFEHGFINIVSLSKKQCDMYLQTEQRIAQSQIDIDQLVVGEGIQMNYHYGRLLESIHQNTIKEYLQQHLLRKANIKLS